MIFQARRRRRANSRTNERRRRGSGAGAREASERSARGSRRIGHKIEDRRWMVDPSPRGGPRCVRSRAHRALSICRAALGSDAARPIAKAKQSRSGARSLASAVHRRGRKERPRPHKVPRRPTPPLHHSAPSNAEAKVDSRTCLFSVFPRRGPSAARADSPLRGTHFIENSRIRGVAGLQPLVIGSISHENSMAIIPGRKLTIFSV